MDPNFWDNPKKAEVVLKELKIHKQWIKEYEGLASHVDDLEVLSEFYREGEVTEEELDAKHSEVVGILEDAEFKSTLNQKEDELSCNLEINAGAGGTEACDWVEMLYRMYIMYGEKNGYKVSEVNRVNGDVAA